MEGNPALMLAASQLVGLAAAGATEGDVQKGAELAKNATAYNYLNHHEVDDLVNDLKGCRGAANPTACRADLTLKYESISDQKTGMHLMLCSDLGSCEAQRTAVELGNAALDQYEGNGGLSWEERLIVRGFQGSNQDDTRLAVQKTVQGSHAEMLSVLPGVGLVGGKGGGGGSISNPLVVQGIPSISRSTEITELFSSTNTRSGIQIGNRSLIQVPNTGNAKIFSGATEVEVKQYFSELTKAASLPSPRTIAGKGDIYVVSTPEGNFTLRNFSSSSGKTGPTWTIDVPKTATGTTYNPEIKFLTERL